MTIQILSDSETGRRSYKKEVNDFLENGLVGANIPQGSPLRITGKAKQNTSEDSSHIQSAYASSQANFYSDAEDQDINNG